MAEDPRFGMFLWMTVITQGRRVRVDPLTLALLADEWERRWQHAAACGTSLRPDGWVFAHPRSLDGAVAERPDAFSTVKAAPARC
jgi:hypothetical protein